MPEKARLDLSMFRREWLEQKFRGLDQSRMILR